MPPRSIPTAPAMPLPALRLLRPAALALGLALALAGCDAGSTVSQDFSLLEILEEESQFSLLEEALAESSLRSRLRGEGPFTLFAPTNVAFEGLGGPALARLRASGPLLEKVVGAHIVAGEIRPEDFRDGEHLQTLAGTELEVRVEAGRVTVGGLDVRRLTEASNGFLYAADVLLLEHLTAAERLSISGLMNTFRQLVERAGLLGELGGEEPFTLFVPIDDAFEALGSGATQRLLDNAALRERLLTHHLVRGRHTRDELVDGPELTSEAGFPLHIEEEDGLLRVEGREVLLADVEVANGAIHLLGDVITSNLDVREVAALAGLNLWVRAAEGGGVAGTLAGEGPFTVLAPNNNAFGSTDDVAFYGQEGLLGALARIHVVPGLFLLEDLLEQDELPTLEGASLRVVRGTGESVTVGRSMLQGFVRTDLLARNGVIHILPGLIDPPMNLFEAVIFERRRQFLRGLRRAGLVEELSSGGPFTVFAPTEEAWNALSESVRFNLFQSEAHREEQRAVLRYHIGIGAYGTEALPPELATLAGHPLGVVIPPMGPIQLEHARGTAAASQSRLELSNGILYRSEGVLFPPGVDV